MITWDEWRRLGGVDLFQSPGVMSLAKAYSTQPHFQRWLGYESPAIVPIQPCAMIAMVSIIRSVDDFGSWDMTPVVIEADEKQFDATIEIPSAFQSFWKAGFFSEVQKNTITLSDQHKVFRCGLDEFRRIREQERERVRRHENRSAFLERMQ